MANKFFLEFLVLFLALSFLRSPVAVRQLEASGRTMKSQYKICWLRSSLPLCHAQDAVDLSNGEVLVLDMGEGYVEGRMDLQSTDYPGTGANNRHNPKTPGGA